MGRQDNLRLQALEGRYHRGERVEAVGVYHDRDTDILKDELDELHQLFRSACPGPDDESGLVGGGPPYLLVRGSPEAPSGRLRQADCHYLCSLYFHYVVEAFGYADGHEACPSAKGRGPGHVRRACQSRRAREDEQVSVRRLVRLWLPGLQYPRHVRGAKEVPFDGRFLNGLPGYAYVDDLDPACVSPSRKEQKAELGHGHRGRKMRHYGLAEHSAGRGV